MRSTPTLEERAATDAVAIVATVTMGSMGDVLPPLTPRLARHLVEHGVDPSGPPFWRYRVIDMAGLLEVEVGFPVASARHAQMVATEDVVAGVLPAGTYVTTIHVGHPDGLIDATAALLEWAEHAGVTWDRTTGDDGGVWGCRLEEYLTDPAEEPDLTKWRTRLAFKTAD